MIIFHINNLSISFIYRLAPSFDRQLCDNDNVVNIVIFMFNDSDKYFFMVDFNRLEVGILFGLIHIWHRTIILCLIYMMITVHFAVEPMLCSRVLIHSYSQYCQKSIQKSTAICLRIKKCLFIQTLFEHSSQEYPRRFRNRK